MTPRVVIGGAFELIDFNGDVVTDKTFRGKYLLIFFGFTHCKVVCPENLGKLSGVLEQMGESAASIQPLYVTVDPERDSPDVMRAFLVDRFPRFIGLTGERSQINQMKALYKVWAEREQASTNGSYDVPHSAMTFLMGPDGDYMTHFTEATSADRMKQRLIELIGQRAGPGTGAVTEPG